MTFDHGNAQIEAGSSTECNDADPEPAPRPGGGPAAVRGHGMPPSGGGGDRSARAEWLARAVLPHRPWLQRWIARQFPREADLEDIIQESFERVMCVADPLAIANPRAYLGQTARILILYRMRRQRIVQIDYHDDLDGLGLQSAWPLQDVEAASREELRLLDQALSRLPERTREVVRLRRLECVSQRETARRLGISESAIEKHLRRAMRSLRASVSPAVPA